MHRMEIRDIQIGLSMAWHGLTDIVKVVTGFPFDYARQPIAVFGKRIPDMEVIYCTDDKNIVGKKTVSPSFQFLTNAQWMEKINAVMANVPGSYVESLGTYADRTVRYVALCLNDKREKFKI